MHMFSSSVKSKSKSLFCAYVGMFLVPLIGANTNGGYYRAIISKVLNGNVKSQMSVAATVICLRESANKSPTPTSNDDHTQPTHPPCLHQLPERDDLQESERTTHAHSLVHSYSSYESLEAHILHDEQEMSC